MLGAELTKHKEKFEKAIHKLSDKNWDITCKKGVFLIKKSYRTYETYTEYGVIDIATNKINK